MKLKGLIAGILLAMTFGVAHAQPNWFTAPSIVSVGALNVTVRFGIDVPGTVYIIIFNSNVTTTLTSTYVRNAAIAGPSGGMVATAVITVTAGQANMTLQQYFDLVNAARAHSLYIVAADGSGNLMADPVRLSFTTLACPSVKLKTYFGNLGECVNLGAIGYFSASPMPLTPTGVLKGTVWTIDWGDGTTWSYTSAADDDIPPDQTHTFTTITDCNYVGVWTIQNPCGEFSNGSSVFVVHGREIPDDGDGDIRMREPVSGDFDITYVCEGKETSLVLVDETEWNCQDPEVPAPLIAIPNTSNRHIQFVYGETPAGAIMNTITGNVMIAGSNVANSSNGYVAAVQGPFAPPNPNTVSDVITIPATAVAGERFYVYLKYWNKCNPYIDENLDYVDDFFIIEVVEAPDPPSVVSPLTYCYGSVPSTLTVNPTVPSNTINWYSDAALTNLLYTGTTYTHGITGPGTFTLYVTEVIGTGGCESTGVPIVLDILPVVGNNIIASDQSICYNTVPAPMTGGLPTGGTGIYVYQWQRSTSSSTSGFSAAPGTNNLQNYTPPSAITTTTWYRRAVTSGLCTGYSNSIEVTVYPAFNPGTIKSAQSICYNTAPSKLTINSAPSGGEGTYTYQWQNSLDNTTWSNISGATASSYSPPVLTVSTYYRMVVTDAVCGAMPTPSILITVYDDLDGGEIGPAQTICYNSAPSTLTNITSPSGGDGTYFYRWYRSTNGTSWQQISGANSSSYTPGALTVSTWYRRRVTNTCGTDYTDPILITVLGPLTSGSVGSPQTICYNTAPSTLTELTAPTGGIGVYTYQWQQSPNNSVWSNISGATSATYSPGVLTASTYYRRVVTSGTCGSSNSASVLITVYGELTPGIVGPAQSICYNTAPATLTQTTAPSGGTGVYTYQWQSSPDNVTWTNISGATGSSYSPGVLTSSIYFRRNVTSGTCGSVDGIPVLITVYADLAPGSIGSNQTICYNTVPATLTETAAPTGGSGVYSYQWQRSTDNSSWSNISGATASTYTPGALTTEMYYRRNVTSSTCGTVSSNSVLISLYSTLTLAQLNSDMSICNNTSTTFYIEITGGTPPYIIDYTRNGTPQTQITGYTSGTAISTGVLTTGTYNYLLTNVTDSHGCQAQSLGTGITVSVGTLPTSATFTGSGDLCYNTPAYLTSEITGGGAPYKLYITGLASSPVTGYYSGDVIDLGILAPGTYSYTLTAVEDNCGQTLAAGLPITHTFTVFDQLTGGTIGATQTICYNTLPAPFTDVTSPTGGTALTYQWQKSPAGMSSWNNITGANGLAYTETTALTASTDYRRVTTSGNGCGTVYSNTITVTVYADFTPGSIGSPQTICYNTVPAGLTELTAPSGGTGTYTYQWQSSADNITWNPIAGANSSTYSPGAMTATTYFRRNVTSGSCGTISSLPVLITVYADLMPGSIGSDQSICYSSAPATLTSLAPATGGTGVYDYQWQISSDNTNWFNLGGATSESYIPGVLTNDRYYRRNATSGTCGTVSTAPVHIIVYSMLMPGAIGTSQTICYNTIPAPLTEFVAPSGGSGVYTYQWQSSSDGSSWSDISGATMPGYSPGALTATTYFRRAVTNGTCGTVYSGNVIITVYLPLTSGSVGSPQSICYNTVPATLTELTAPTGGTGTYTYQWQSSPDNITWSNISGANGTDYSPGSLTSTIYYRRNVTSGACGTASSSSVMITVFGDLTPGTIGNDQFLCYNTVAASLIQLTAPSGGTGVYTYQWQVSTDGISFSDIPGASLSAYSPGVLTSSYYYRRNVTSGTCGTVSSTPVFITVYDNLTAGAIAANQTICYNTVPATLTESTAPTGGTGTYTYQWQSSPDNITWTNIGLATSATYSPPALTSTTYYRRNVTSGTCGTLSTPSVQIQVYPDLTPGTIGSPQTICENDVAAPLISLSPATGGTGVYVYQWQSSPDNVTWSDISGENSVGYSPGVMTVTTYYRRNVTSGSCGTLNTASLLITVTQLPVISDQSASVCSGETLNHIILLNNYTNPGDNVTFTWPAPTLSAGLTGGTARTIPSSDPLSDVFVNTTGGPQTATYYVTPSYNGCAGAVKPIVVTIGSQPVLDPGLDRSVCSNMPTGLVLAVAPSSVPATSYNILSITIATGLGINAGNVSAANGIADPSYLAGDIFINKTGADKTVIYRVQPVFGTTCIGDPVDIIVTILPQPVILPGQGMTTCSNTPANLEIRLLPDNTPAGTLLSWGVPVMSDGSSQGTAASNVSVDPSGSIHITDLFVNYSTSPITATYTVTPVSAGSCVGDDEDVIITINPEPAAPVISGENNLCVGETNIVYSVPLHAGSSYTWTVPASIGTKTFDLNSNAIIINAAAVAGSGTITVTETNSYGCTGIAGTFDVTVMAPSPVAPVTGDDEVCALETVVYSVPATAGSVYTWTLPTGSALVGDPTGASITVMMGTVSGTVSVREVNAAGCITDHTPLLITVKPQPTAVISNNGTVCQEDTFPINISLTGTAPWNLTYAINGVSQPSVNIASSPYTLNAASAGTYTIVSVTDANLCSGTGIGNATVSYYPVPTATLSGTTSVCTGGSALLTVSLTGTSPYNFVYTDGTTPVTVTNYVSTVYTANVTPAATVTYTLLSMSDSHGCDGTLAGSAMITVNAPPSLTLAGTNLSCFADNSGSIDLTVAGSGAPFSYSWTGPDGFTAGVEDISSLAAGYYAVTVTNIYGCSSSANITLTQPSLLTMGNTGNIALLCNGDNNGSGSFTPAGGTSPYTFTTITNTAGAVIATTASSATFTNAGAGTITIQTDDANGCQATSSLTITEPQALSLSALLSTSIEGSHNINCFNGTTGTISLTVTGGTAPYNYTWTTADGSGLVPAAASQTSLTAGTYTVTVTDANGCTASGSYTLTHPSPLAVTVAADDNLIGTCASSTSQLTATVTGGVELAGGGYLYSWSPSAGLSAANIADPVAKPASTTTYTVIVTDANGCTATGSVTVNVAPVLTAFAFTDDNTIGDCPSSVAHLDVNVSGGEAPYLYSWSPSTGLNFTNIKDPEAKPAATTTYTVTVTDANGCMAVSTVTITVAPPITVNVTVDDNLIGTCLTSVANLSATVTGGEGGYTYSWDNASTLGSPASANTTAKPAVTTTYTVTVTDANGCTGQGSITLNIAPPLSVVASADDITIGTCASSVSQLDATVTGGEGGYTYKWTPSTGLDDSYIQNPVAKPSVTTTYTVTVTDANGCTASSSVTVSVLPALTLTLSADDYSIGTCGTSEAQITSVVGGGEPGYTYSWSPAAGLSATNIANPVAKPAATTTYTLVVTDANGCTVSNSITINVLSPLAATATASDLNIGTCAVSTSTLNVSVTGGEPSYSYSWSPAAGLSATNIANPVAKPAVTTTYTVTVTDNNGCSTTAQVTVNVLSPLSPVASADDMTISTCATSRANLDVTVTGGEPSYSYSWSPATGLNSTTVQNPVAKPAVTTTYTVTVTDANGCQATDNVTITVQPPVSVNVIATDYIISSCSSSETSLTATAIGGEELAGGGYTWSWAPADGLSATNISNPVAKPTATTTYTVTATDANGCTASNTITIQVRPPLTAVASASDLLIGYCAGSSSVLDVTVTGGEAPYSYLWDNAATLDDATVKSPTATPAVMTTYTVAVTDVNGCTVTASVTIDVTPPVVVTATVNDSQIGECASSVTTLNAIASGGEYPYSYLWDNAASLSDPAIANPVAKPAVTTTYTVTVTDINGCSSTAQVTVNVAPALDVTVTATDNLIGTCPSSLSVLTATVSGGEELAGGGYTYSWSPAAGLNYTNVQSPVAKPAVTTTYTITVTDGNGCTATDNITITVAPPLSLTATPVVYAGGYNIRCNGGTDGSIDLTVNGGEAPFSYSWSGPSGFTSSDEDINGLVAGTYNISVTDANGCSSTTTVVLSEPAPLTLGTTPDVVLSCYGDNDASGSFSVSGGTAPYTVTASSNTAGATIVVTATGLSFTGGAVGEVTASVTDANGCSTQATIYITQPVELLPGTIAGDQEVCYQGDPAILSEVTAPSGGPGTILLQWERSTDSGITWSNVSGATMASYDPPAGIAVSTMFRRRATSGTCDPVYSNTVTVIVNPLPVASVSGAATVCPGDAAVVVVTVTTGESPYAVVLSDGTTVSGYVSGSNITVYPSVTTSYTITSITDNNGCYVSAPHANLTGSALITVNYPPEIVDQPDDIIVCEGETATFEADAGLTTNPSYQWYYNDGTGPQILTGETNATLSVVTTSAMNGYRYTVVVTGDCPLAVTSDEALLTVRELPEIISGPSDVELCAGEDATLTVDAGVTTNPVYQWYVNTGSGWNIVSGSRYQGANSSTLTIVSVLELMSGYQYKVRVSGDCLPYVESVAVVLTVTHPTEITQQPVSQTVCEGMPVSFTVNAGSTSSSSYQWEVSSDGGTTWTPIPGATNDTYTIASATSAMNNNMYRVVVSGSCGSDVTSQIVYLIVNELPEILTPPSDLTLCEGEIGNFTVDAGNTTGATYIWQISTDGGTNWTNLTETAKYFGVNSSNLKINGVERAMTGYMFRVIVSGTCVPPVTSPGALLVVNTRPEILDQPDPASICENTSVSFTVSAQGTGINYQWYVDQGGGMGFETLTDVGVYTGTNSATLNLTSVPLGYNGFRYRVVVTGSCAPPASSDIVTLNVAPVTGITDQPDDLDICEFGAASFNVGVTGADLGFQWQQYDGSTWSDLSNNGTYMGVTTNELTIFGVARIMDGYRYRVVIVSKCSAAITSDEAVLTVYTSPAITDQPDNVKSCPGSTISYSVTAEGSGLTYQWQVNSGSGFTDVTDTAPYSGTTTNTLTITNLTLGMNGYLVRVIVSGTCMPPVYSSYATLNVYAEPVIMTQPADAEVCDGSMVVFYSQVYTTAAGETMLWQVNEGSGWNDLSESGIYQGTQSSQLLISQATALMNGWLYRLQITGPCGNYYTDDALLTVNQLPDGMISPSDTMLVCGAVPTQIHGNPFGGSGVYTNHRWFGDVGPLSQFNIENPEFNTTFPGYYNLVYQVTDSKGCIGIDTVVIEVEKPAAMFTPDPPSGCQPLTVSFTNSSSGYTSLVWDFGDGETSTDENPTHEYPNPSSSLLYYTVRLQITSENGCTSEMPADITVYPEVLSNFYFSDDTICSGDIVTLSSLPGGFKYYWNFGDGQEGLGANVINHSFTNYTTAPVTYNVTLTATSFFGCEGSTTLPIVVYPVPLPGFNASPVSQTMPNTTVTFTNTTNAGTWDWLWSFDDGNTSVAESPVHVYGGPGTYAVNLFVSNGVCYDEVTHSVDILPTPPIADFDSIPSGCKVWTISPNNTSLYATSYYWEFGDGSVSTVMNPVYTYTTAGVYRVTLTVTGPGGTDSKSQLVNVYQSPLAYFEVSPSTVYVNDEKVRCFNLSQGAVSYIWEFGDGDTSHVADPYHRYTAEGVYEITLHAYSANGCYDTYVLSPAVTVMPFGDLSFATVFRPNQTGEIDLDELPTSGDAVNQFFYPPIRETVIDYHLQIFNRWGTLIYESYDINRPWNGYYKHKLCPQGVYVWLVEGKYANGRPFKKVGDITLLH